jgi:hypothetical protein
MLLIILLEACGASFFSHSSAAIEVTDTEFGQRICKRFNSLGLDLGNQGGSQCTLDFDSDTGTLRGDIQLTAKHSWGTIKVFEKKYEVALEATIAGYFIYDLPRQDVVDSKLVFNFGTLEKVVGPVAKTLNVGSVSIDTQTLIDFIEGDFDIVEMVKRLPGSPYPDTVCDEGYEAAINKYNELYGVGNFYFASKGFVEWADPIDRTFSWGTALVLTAGSAAGLIMQEVSSELRKEGNDILDWLARKGQQQAENLLVKVLTGERFTWPHVVAAWQPVKCWKRFKLLTRSWDKLPANHPGFVLVWKSDKTRGWGDLLPEQSSEIYAELTDKISQQLGEKGPRTEEQERGFAEYGDSYAERIFSEVATNLYREIYGSNTAPDETKIAEIINDLSNGLSYAEVEAKIEKKYIAFVQKKRALQFVFDYYMLTRHKQ